MGRDEMDKDEYLILRRLPAGSMIECAITCSAHTVKDYRDGKLYKEDNLLFRRGTQLMKIKNIGADMMMVKRGNDDYVVWCGSLICDAIKIINALTDKNENIELSNYPPF